MEFSRQENWNRLPFPSPGDLPDPGIEPRSSSLQADGLLSEPPGKPTGSRVNQILLIFFNHSKGGKYSNLREIKRSQGYIF